MPDLAERDLTTLERRWITAELARQAGLSRVSSPAGSELIGRNGSGNYEGLAIPNILPGQMHAREFRLRRDHPELEFKPDGSTREKAKYLHPLGRGNVLYFTPGTPGNWLQNTSLPVAMVEGEFKSLSLWRLAHHDTATPRWLPIGIPGCWGWRGTVGKAPGPDGDRRDLKGPISDLDRIAWEGRSVYLVPDTNVANNWSVAAAWRELGKELGNRGARMVTVVVPLEPGVNGIDDYLDRHGPEAGLALFAAAKPRNAARDYNRSDAGNGERLVDRHGRDLRFVENWGWLAWDGSRWRRDDFGEVGRRALETARAILSDASRLEDTEERKKLVGFALKSESRTSIANMIALAENMEVVRTRPEEFDNDPWLLNVANGTLDLRTAELRPHRRRDLITRLTPVEWDPTADCPLFLTFLDQIFRSNKSLLRFVQKLVGYSLTGLTIEQILVILWGNGANGKSTLIEVLSALLSEYGAKCPITTFLANRNDSIPNDLAALQGVRFVCTSEVDEGRRMAESLVKDVTGGEKIRARFLHKEWFEYKPEFKLWLSTNHKPIIKGMDHAIWRRIRLVPFGVTFAQENQDKQLASKLKAELRGILCWAAKGCLAWRQEGLEPPEEVMQATEGYREEMDTVAAFLTECTEAETTDAVSAKELYRAYCAWCDEGGERPGSQRALGVRLSERGYDSTHKRGGNYWIGIRLRKENVKA